MRVCCTSETSWHTAHMSTLPRPWCTFLGLNGQEPWAEPLTKRVQEARRQGAVYPAPDNVFAAFALAPEAVRVIILGQDPYHGPDQAMGLSFSVPDGVKVPPSLRNIFREIESQTGAQAAGRSGDLRAWRDQGVLLLNTVLTVGAHDAGSHRGWGWEHLTDRVISVLSEKREGLVFMLWGRDALAKRPLIDATRHLVLTAPHPSPLSAHTGFFGNGHFTAANAHLSDRGGRPICW